MSKTRAFVLTVSDEDGIWVVSDSFSRVYGEGVAPMYALYDWVSTLAMRYRELKREELAAGMEGELAAIDRVVGP